MLSPNQAIFLQLPGFRSYFYNLKRNNGLVKVTSNLITCELLLHINVNSNLILNTQNSTDYRLIINLSNYNEFNKTQPYFLIVIISLPTVAFYNFNTLLNQYPLIYFLSCGFAIPKKINICNDNFDFNVKYLRVELVFYFV
jgi:hypothetical protein